MSHIALSPTYDIWKKGNKHCYSGCNFIVPRSQCSDNCLPGYRKMPKTLTHTCCYDCAQCPEGEISNRTGTVC
uniref:GPCR family 3 nine cysteines domain-containing protein n=1 Tax=Leptobrachium leishanense TaxID=445787 RepID=A0A8C5PIV6_9ANUR